MYQIMVSKFIFLNAGYSVERDCKNPTTFD